MPNVKALANRNKKAQKNKAARSSNRFSRRTVDCATYLADPEANAGSTVLLQQSDFDHGTVRLTTPVRAVLTEDISFNPNRGETNSDGTLVLERTQDWNPYAGQTNEEQYFDQTTGQLLKPFTLGFFAAITVEADSVIIDLNGYEFKQSDEHAIMQRFYANIELGSAPFPPANDTNSQGPANFGVDFRPATNVTIQNGTIGRSSHHGIHGNLADGVLIQDVIFKNQEVASISINGSKNITVERCEDRGRVPDGGVDGLDGIPILGTWSALRFAKSQILGLAPLGLTDYATIMGDDSVSNGPLWRARVTEKEIFDDLFGQGAAGNNGIVYAGGASAGNAVFKNRALEVDGFSYGMLFNKFGAAVGAPLANQPETFDAENVFLSDIKIENVRTTVVEIPSASKLDGTGNQVDGIGAVFQLLNTYTDDDGGTQGLRAADGTYSGTPLSDLQIAFAQLSLANLLPDGSKNPVFGTLSIDSNVVDWATDGTGKKLLDVYGDANLAAPDADNSRQKLKLYAADGTTPVDDAGTPVEYLIRWNGDSMHHTGSEKGLIGIRMDGIQNALLENVRIEDSCASGALGGGTYIGSADGGHEGQGDYVGYGGTWATGVRLSGCKTVQMSNVEIVNTDSLNGPAHGVIVAGGTTDVSLETCRVDGVVAGSGQTDKVNAVQLKGLAGYPNHAPQARGVKVEPDTEAISYSELDVLPVQSLASLKRKEEEINLNAQRRGGQQKRRTSRNF